MTTPCKTGGSSAEPGGQVRRDRSRTGRARRNAVPALPRRDPRTGRQRRERGEPGPWPEHGVSAGGRPDIEGRPRFQGHRGHHEVSVIELREAQRRILAERGTIADLQQVPPAIQEIDTPMDVHPPADPGSQGAEGGLLEHRASKPRPRHEMHRPLHDPVAQEEAAPDRRPQRLVTPDEHPFDHHGERDCQRRVHGERQKTQHGNQQERGNHAEHLGQDGQRHADDQIGHPGCDAEPGQEPGGLHRRDQQGSPPPAVLFPRIRARRRVPRARGTRGQLRHGRRFVKVAHRDPGAGRIAPQQAHKNRRRQ